MTADPDTAAEILKSKAMLRLRREREVFQFRQERARTETWLDVFQVLTLQLNTDRNAVVQQWAKLLIERLGYQVAGAYHRAGGGEFASEWCEPASWLASRIQLDAPTQAFMQRRFHGRYEAGAGSPEELRGLAEQLHLSKFYWVFISSSAGELATPAAASSLAAVRDDDSLRSAAPARAQARLDRDFLLITGFSEDTASFHALNDTDAGHFVMFTSHLGALLSNVWLLDNLSKKRFELDRSNRDLAESLQALRVAQREVIQVSRMAGMAEVATGVLHNVGNILNSVSVSSELISKHLGELRVGTLRKSVELLELHQDDLAAFFATDPRGSRLVSYLRLLTQSLQTGRDDIASENDLLSKRIDHIKVVIANQQEHARPISVIESCALPNVIAEAFSLVEVAYAAGQIELVVDCPELPEVAVDRHQLLQILVNLLSNARHAVLDSDQPHRVVRIDVAMTAEQFSIRLSDNGIGISRENQAKLFTHGFTTKKHGHGFGLHNAILTAQAMGGGLSCASDGPGTGAAFTLELPRRSQPIAIPARIAEQP